MKLVLLPGMDGTGLLFQPLIQQLPKEIDTLIISYPTDKCLNYDELIDYVKDRLPKNDDFILLGESFSGPIAYQIAAEKPMHLKSVIFVASFLSPPHILLEKIYSKLPFGLLLSMPIPSPVIKHFLLGKDADMNLISQFRKSIKQVVPGVISDRLKMIANLPLHYENCSIPSVYIEPSHDRLVPTRCRNEFEEKISNIRIKQVNGPHFILQFNPFACADIIKQEIDAYA